MSFLYDDADLSTDVDSLDEDTLVSHEPPLLPKSNKFEEHPQRQKRSFPTPTRQRPLPAELLTHQVNQHLSQPKLFNDSSFKPTDAVQTRPAALSNPYPTPRPASSTYTPHPPQSSSPSGSAWLPSAYPRSLAKPHYDILPDDLSCLNTALSPPPWHRSRQGGKVSYEPEGHTLRPRPPLPTPNKLEEHPQRQKRSYPPTRQRPRLAKLLTHQVHSHLSKRKLITDSSFKPTGAGKPTAPSNPFPTPRPTPSTYTPHPPQSCSPSGSPCLPSAYPSSPAEPHYHILPDDLSSLNTVLSPPPWHLSRQAGKVSFELMDHTFCPIHHSTLPCWPCDRVRNRQANEELRFPF